MPQTVTLLETHRMRLEMETQGTTVTFKPVGDIDEEVNFSAVLQALADLGAGAQSVQFDLGHITRINSCGVREWILLMERLSSSSPLVFSNVCEVFLDQANMVSKLFGKKGSRIVNFQAPYHCSACKTDLTLLLEPKMVQFQGGDPVAPPMNCPQCGGAMQFDSIVEEYFEFLR